MSTSTTLAIVASNQAALAAQMAEQARCHSVVATYQPQQAGVLEMRDYARCVFTLHGSGEPLTDSTALVLKVLIVAALLCGAAGAVWGWGEDGPIGAFMGFLIGACAVGIVAFVGALVIAGVGFVLS